MNRPTQVEALPGFRLRVVYQDGIEGVIDLSAEVGRGVFAPLADEQFFSSVHIGKFGQIAWTEEIEICPDAVRERDEWAAFGAKNLARAYGDDEPEYSVADIKPSSPKA